MAFMTHPKHGATNVSDAEVPTLEANGWKVSTPEEWRQGRGKDLETEPKVRRPRKAKE